jgi:hypothetical protein
MPTDAQILANRQNASKSTGPKTPEGKTIASKNSLKHGLSSASDVILSESQSEFELFRDAIFKELAPQTPVETILVQRIVSLSWRLKRTSFIQNRALDAIKLDHPLSWDEERRRSKIPYNERTSPDSPENDPDIALGRAAVNDFSESRALDRLLMYERRIENSLYRTFLELQKLRTPKSPKPQSNEK